MSTHTPTPWKVYYAKNNGQKILGIGKADTGEGITNANGIMWGDDSEAAANAEFIILAVNNHVALVECLKGMLALYRPEPSDGIPSSWPEKARDVLRTVGGS